MEGTSTRRILLIGLDGADLLYMEPWLAAGSLPNLAALIAQGALAPLESTVADHTLVAWPALFTGKNPGKTGLTDLTLRQPGSTTIVPSSLLRGGVQTQPFWAYLEEHDLRTLVINVPVNYPPRPLKGRLIAGFDAPEKAARYAWPESFQAALDAAGYREKVLDIQHRLTLLTGPGPSGFDPEAYLAMCQDLTVHQTAFTRRLMADQEWDVAFVAYQLTDFINHFTADDSARLRVYQMADRMVGELVAQAGENTTVLIVSDHGSTQPARCIGLARVFADAGLMAFRPAIAADVIPWIVSAVLPGDAGRRLGRRMQGMWRRLPEGLRRVLSWLPLRFYPGWSHYYSSIDWPRTRAYVANAMKTVYINRSDLMPHGTVRPGADYEAACQDVIDRLEAVRDPATGEQVFEVLRVNDIWSGPFIDETAPDLILKLREERYYIQQADPRGRAFWDEAPDKLGGTHRRTGLLLLSGEGIRRGDGLPSASIFDVVPTLLYLLGVPLPLELDGQPVTGAVEPAFLDAHPVQRSRFARPDVWQPVASDYTQEELESVLDKLSALGYIE
jgi:predicted AlkP superfamily phosphohydrolase/phosphomutase